jgi:hypothetical protein
MPSRCSLESGLYRTYSIAHLIYWNQFDLDYVRDRFAGKSPKGFDTDFDRQNQEAAQQWAGHQPVQLLEELDRIRGEIMDLILEIGPEGLQVKWKSGQRNSGWGVYKLLCWSPSPSLQAN